MLTLDEAIKRAEEVAKDNEDIAKMYCKGSSTYINYGIKCKDLAEYHRQIAEWLTLLKQIQSAGDCNTCYRKKDCEYMPQWGELVRYNCPFYETKN